MLLAQELPQVEIPEAFLKYDDNLAKEYIERAAYLGFAKAQLKMGSAYELCNLGCEFNPVLSIHYNALAARQGEAEAEMALSKWFLCGYESILQKNDEMAYVYAERAAQAGLPTALFAMGYFYEIGVYVSANVNKALEWYRKAAKLGNEDAHGRIDSISQSGALSRKEHEQVAISRIRSQYGSKRGGRPDRFKKKAPEHLPAVSDTPEPSAPYPLDDRPPSVTQQPARSFSAAPYPLDDGPPPTNYSRPGPGPPSASPYPNMRASSAVPQSMHSSTAFNLRVHSPAATSPVSADPGARPLRAASAQGYRQPGGPSVEHPEPSNYSDTPSMHSHDSGKTQPLKLDIGFSAPVEERRNRLQKPGVQSRSPHPTTPVGGRQSFDRPSVSQRPPGPSGRLGSVPLQSKPSPIQQRPDMALSPPPARTGRGSRSPSPGPGRRIDSSSSYPPPSGRTQSSEIDGTSISSSSTVRSKTPSSAPAPAAKPAQASAPTQKPQAQNNKPPGKGPKTFEEMGIPQTNKDNDCVSNSVPRLTFSIFLAFCIANIKVQIMM